MKIYTTNFQLLAVVSMSLIDAVKNNKEYATIKARDIVFPKDVLTFYSRLGCKVKSSKTSSGNEYKIYITSASEEINLVNLRWIILLSSSISAFLSRAIEYDDYLSISRHTDEMTDFIRRFLDKLHCRIEENNTDGRQEYRIYLPENN